MIKSAEELSVIRRLTNLLDEPNLSGVQLDTTPKSWSKKDLDEQKAHIDPENFRDFELLAKVVLLNDPEADLYDVFDTIRTRVLGGWPYTPEFLEKLDAEIEDEYQRSL